jgi:hypothetical protein
MEPVSLKEYISARIKAGRLSHKPYFQPASDLINPKAAPKIRYVAIITMKESPLSDREITSENIKLKTRKNPGSSPVKKAKIYINLFFNITTPLN